MSERRDWGGIVDIVIDQLHRYYVDPEMATHVVDVVRGRHGAGDYAHLLDDASFADAVTDDLIAASGDQHLRLRHSIAALPELDDPEIPESGRHELEVTLAGHGFARVERLSGNVGYIDIRRFMPARISGHVAVAAMTLIDDTDALIIDLRLCPGGEPDMVALLASYLFDERTPLNAIHFPAEDRTVQWWTDPFVPGGAYGQSKPVFVLLSKDSYSAAEGFSYDLQQHSRALLIGEPTATGVSYFDYRYRVSEHLMFSVPSGYVVNPVSGRGWHPDGVQPDLLVDATAALDTAYALALEHVLTLGDDGYRQRIADQARRRLTELRS